MILYLESPSVCYETIEERLQWVDAFYEDSALRREIHMLLKPIKDIERSLQRIRLNRGSPRDLSAISQSIIQTTQVTQRLSEKGDVWQQRVQEVPDVTHLANMLQRALKESLPGNAEEGNFIREK